MTRTREQATAELMSAKAEHLRLNRSIIERQGRIAGLPTTGDAIGRFAHLEALEDELAHCLKTVEEKLVAIHMLDGSIILLGQMLDSVKGAHEEAWGLVREWCESMPAGVNGFGHKVPMDEKIEQLGAALEEGVRKATLTLEEDDDNKRRLDEVKAQIEAIEDERASTRLAIVRRRDAVNDRPSACDMLECAFLQEGLKARGDLAQFDSESPGQDLRETLAALEFACLSPYQRQVKAAELKVAAGQLEHHQRMRRALDLYFDACMSVTEMQDQILDAGERRVRMVSSIPEFSDHFKKLLDESEHIETSGDFNLADQTLRRMYVAHDQVLRHKETARALVAQCQDRDKELVEIRKDRETLDRLSQKHNELSDEVDRYKVTACETPVENEA